MIDLLIRVPFIEWLRFGGLHSAELFLFDKLGGSNLIRVWLAI